VNAVENGLFFQAMKRFGPDGAGLYGARRGRITDQGGRDRVETIRAGRRDGHSGMRNRLAEQVRGHDRSPAAQASGATVVVAHCSHLVIVDTVTITDPGRPNMGKGCPQYFYLREDEVSRWRLRNLHPRPCFIIG